jgi:hypothetical protein
MNVLAEGSGEVTGIVDWEMATSQPFGINCGCIHYLAGEIINRQWQMKTAFEEMERGFWRSLLQHADPNTRQLIESNSTAVQTSVTIGTFQDLLVQGRKANGSGTEPKSFANVAEVPNTSHKRIRRALHRSWIMMG